ncbi:MAG: plasmid pRiA4b ORF-3 family protein [Planctomycetota bacterium]
MLHAAPLDDGTAPLDDGTAPQKGKTQIAELRITLRGSKPPIWRRVAVPLDSTLAGLHDVVQVAMGWTDDHLHQFVLHVPRPKPGSVVRRFFHRETSPVAWRTPRNN